MNVISPFDPIAAARLILRQARTAALATLQPGGAPFCSLVTVATDPVGAPVLLLSSLAAHTANLTADPRAALLLEGTSTGDPLQGGRISISGSLRPVPRGADTTIRRRFLARQPEARLYAGFRDFDFWQMTPEVTHLVAGFGRIVKIDAADLLLDPLVAQPIAEAEDRLALAGEAGPDGRATFVAVDGTDWRVLGFDSEGVDLGRDGAAGLEMRRLCFAHPVRDAAELSSALKEIATKPIE